MENALSAYGELGPKRYRETSGLYYEDFEIGDTFEHRPGRTILDVDNTWFTLLTMNTQELHFDAAYASKTEWKKPLVDSTFTLALLTGMSVRTGVRQGEGDSSRLRGRHALRGIDNLVQARIKEPPYAGDRDGFYSWGE